ncbi:hypothetical protein, partial [Lysinibacillus sp. F5]|uniref:hypothetical protein n=1 Tax=Lysinibacillus sp. F5 TaxID=1700846 RepID=UPI001E2FA792
NFWGQFSETGKPLNGAAMRSPTGKQVACNGNPFSPVTKTLWIVLFFNTTKGVISLFEVTPLIVIWVT